MKPLTKYDAASVRAWMKQMQRRLDKADRNLRRGPRWLVCIPVVAVCLRERYAPWWKVWRNLRTGGVTLTFGVLLLAVSVVLVAGTRAAEGT